MEGARLSYFLVLGTSAALQVIAVVLAWRLMRVSRLSTARLVLSAALALMAARRLYTLFLALGEPGAPANPGPELFALGISALMVLGVVLLAPTIPYIREALAEHGSLGHVMENADNEIYIFHRETLRFLRVNRGARRNLGYSTDEMAALTPIDIKPNFDLEGFREVLKPLLSGEEQRLVFTTCHERRDGSRYPVEIDLQMATYDGEEVFVAVIMDITERERAERALKVSEEHFRSVIEVVHDLITVVDQDGMVQYQSPAFARMLGYDPEQRIGESAVHLIHPDDVERVRSAYEAFVENRSTTPAITYRLRHADGSWRTVEAVGTRRDVEGRGPELVISQRDITERVRIEDQLRQSQKMETIGTLAGGIAHDFNNLLTPILGYAEMLRDVVADDRDALDDLEQVILAADRAQEIVKQIMVFGRQTARQNASVSLSSLVSETAGLLRVTLPSTITLEIDTNEVGSKVKGDAAQLQQILMNLCTNAVHAMEPDGGTLSIDLAPVSVSEELARERPALSVGRYVRLRVTDTGNGMSEEVSRRIFEPFFTTKEVGKGTGLGLSVAHGIAREHGGELVVQSTLGQGTVFTLWLPLTTDVPEAMASVGASSDRGDRAGRILVVDDEAALRSLTQRILEGAGYDVAVAEGPEAALKLIDEGPFDLVLTDQTMPGQTGLSLGAELKRRNPGLPVLLMTGHSEAVTPASLTAAGISGLLLKPFRRVALLDAIREHLPERPAPSASRAPELSSLREPM